MRVAELLKTWRFMVKLNVRDAANTIGISPSSLSRIERGYIPDGAMLIKLMAWLFGEEHETTTTDAGHERDDAQVPVPEE